jgi:hypothetical protein
MPPQTQKDILSHKKRTKCSSNHFQILSSDSGYKSEPENRTVKVMGLKEQYRSFKMIIFRRKKTGKMMSKKRKKKIKCDDIDLNIFALSWESAS